MNIFKNLFKQILQKPKVKKNSFIAIMNKHEREAYHLDLLDEEARLIKRKEELISYRDFFKDEHIEKEKKFIALHLKALDELIKITRDRALLLNYTVLKNGDAKRDGSCFSDLE
jgi:hypothetical protein